MEHKFDYRWTLKEANFTKDKGKVFSCFACWELRKYGDKDLSGANERCYNKRGLFNNQYVYLDKVCPTLIGKKCCLIRFDIPKYTSKSEVCCISSFPQDYDFCSQLPHYVCGMSVPPIMMAQVASRIYEQWLSKIN